MSIPMVKIPANKVIKILRNSGVKLDDRDPENVGQCLACGAKGWLKKKYGYAIHSTSGVASELTHEEHCPMNEVLDDTGEIIEN